MRLSFDSQAKDYISKKGNVIQIYSTSVTGCCGGTMSVDLAGQVKVGLPHQKDLPFFKKKQVDGVTVFIAGHLYNDKLEKQVSLQRLFFFKQLVLE